MPGTFIACAKTDCKWNDEGMCKRTEIFVDDAVICANYEPEMAGLLGGGMGGMGEDPRAMLLQQMMAGGGGPPPGPGGPPMMGGPPTGAPGPAGPPPMSPTAAPPPRRF